MEQRKYTNSYVNTMQRMVNLGLRPPNVCRLSTG
jgi:hypothetical protein